MLLKKFKVVKCRHCGIIQSTGAVKELRCYRCYKTTEYTEKSVISSFDYPTEATVFCMEVKRKIAQKEQDYDGYFS